MDADTSSSLDSTSRELVSGPRPTLCLSRRTGSAVSRTTLVPAEYQIPVEVLGQPPVVCDGEDRSFVRLQSLLQGFR